MNIETYIKQYDIFLKENEVKKRFNSITNEQYILNEDTPDLTGGPKFDRHYVYSLAWASRILSQIKPSKHIDISSQWTWGTIMSAFIPFEYYELRPIEIHLDNYESKKGNVLCLPLEKNSVESISSLHVIEHIGLGRYGDELDYDGDVKAVNCLQDVTKIDGNILYVVPLGNTARISFNAHRVYTYKQVIEMFSKCELQEFSFINFEGNNGIIKNANEKDIGIEHYGCGCFWFRRNK